MRLAGTNIEKPVTGHPKILIGVSVADLNPLVQADLMPSRCARCDDAAVYFPYRWQYGQATYMCRETHLWIRDWGHKASGMARENLRRPQ
jgi:hypothetical protein